MTIRTNSRYEESAREGNTELTLAAVTYVGDRSTYQDSSIRTQGGYPALDGFQNNQTKIVKLPSTSLGWWERNSNFSIEYDPASIAEALLNHNYVPQQLVGPGFDPDIRDDIHDQLGLEPASGAEGYREQFREIAGVEAEIPEDERTTEGEANRLKHLVSVDRSVLITTANSFEGIDDFLEEKDAQQVNHLKNHDLAEFLAEQDDDTVDRKIDTVEGGGEL